MKFLADENIPRSVVQTLADSGYDICWIRTESPGISDIEVLQRAHRENRIIITFDKDFGEYSVRHHDLPVTGIILFRLYRMPPASISPFIVEIIQSRTDWAGYFSVVEQDRIRMRPLGKE